MSFNPFNNQVKSYRPTRNDEVPHEHDEAVALVRWLRVKKIPHAHISNEGKFNPQYMKKRAACGVSAGFPDYIIFLPNKFLAIELKRRPNITKTGKETVRHCKVSDDQIEWLQTINCYSYATALVAYGCAHAIELIEQEMKS